MLTVIKRKDTFRCKKHIRAPLLPQLYLSRVCSEIPISMWYATDIWHSKHTLMVFCCNAIKLFRVVKWNRKKVYKDV